MLKKLKSILRTLGLYKLPAIETMDQLIDFIDQKASFVSQVTLYTYVKARAGTQYPKMFTNEDFLTSLRIARWHIYVASVCDLALFTVAQLHKAGRISEAESVALCTTIIDRIFLKIDQQDIDKNSFIDISNRGSKRANFVDWNAIADGPGAFQSSSDAMFRWAPIADRLKNEDEEIIRNSIHLRWIGVRRDLKETINLAMMID